VRSWMGVSAADCPWPDRRSRRTEDDGGCSHRGISFIVWEREIVSL